MQVTAAILESVPSAEAEVMKSIKIINHDWQGNLNDKEAGV
jgi:hypothetical protein